MDPLSEVVKLAKLHSVSVGATDVGGDLAIRFPKHSGAFFYCVGRGECWLQIEGEAAALLLSAGDCVVLPSGRPFVLASDLALPPIDSDTVFDHRSNGSVEMYNGGGGCMMFAAHFEFGAAFSAFLLDALEPVVQVCDPSARNEMRAAIDDMIGELTLARPGFQLVVEHLAHIAMIKVLRFHSSEVSTGRVGWLFALSDRRIRAAISAMHEHPAQRWTVATLGEVATMSRTAFAVRFKTSVGMAPLECLTQVRMLMAVNMLEDPTSRLTAVSAALGYESESSFCTAFKRTMGRAPRHYHVS